MKDVLCKVEIIHLSNSTRTRERSLYCPPRTFNSLSMVPSLAIYKLNAMVDSAMDISFLLQGAIAFPAISNNLASRKDIVLNQGDQCGNRPITTKHLFDPLSIPPNTHWPSTLCPLLYLRLPNFDSSTSTIFPGPPIGPLSFSSTRRHTSLAK